LSGADGSDPHDSFDKVAALLTLEEASVARAAVSWLLDDVARAEAEGLAVALADDLSS